MMGSVRLKSKILPASACDGSTISALATTPATMGLAICSFSVKEALLKVLGLAALLEGRRLQLKATFESSLSCFYFQALKASVGSTAELGVNLHRPTLTETTAGAATRARTTEVVLRAPDTLV